MGTFLILTNEFYPYKGGIGRYCEEMIEQLKKEFDVTLACPSYHGEINSYPGLSDISLINFIGGRFKKRQFYLLVAQVLMIDFKKFDHVLIADWPVWLAVSFINRYVPFKKTIQFSLMLHGSEILSFKHGKLAKSAKKFHVFDNVLNIFTNSNYTKGILYDCFGADINTNVCTTYLAANICHFSNSITEPSKKADNFVFLTVGRLDTRKGHTLAIEAIGKLSCELKKSVVYRIVGNGGGKYLAEIESTAKKYQVNVEIVQGADDVQLEREFKNADMFILAARSMPNKIEGFGLVILEAAGYGLPSIVTNVGGIPEVVVNEETGLICEEDIDQLSEAMRKVIADKGGLVGALANNALKHYKTFSWERTCRTTVDKMKQKSCE